MRERRNESRGTQDPGREQRGAGWARCAIGAAALLALGFSPAWPVPIAAPLAAQAAAAGDTMAFYRALDLEAAGKYKESIPLFRTALHSSAVINALLGLERVYAELGWSDSLVAPLDTLIASSPREET